MPAPDYSAMESYKPYSATSGSEEEGSDSKLPDTLMVLADKLGFDEEKAMALHDFIKECMSAEEDGEYAQDTDEDGE